jgi:hypothetical protein
MPWCSCQVATEAIGQFGFMESRAKPGPFGCRDKYTPGIPTGRRIHEMQIKCAHPKCMCAVPDGKEYCSRWCEKNSREERAPCFCGHASCNHIYKRDESRTTESTSA